MSVASVTAPAWPRQNAAAMNAFYGNPDPHGTGRADRAWEDANLTAITPPYPMVLAWDVQTPVAQIHCHKKVAASLARVLAAIGAHYGSPSAIRAARMHLFGGAYCFRPMRGNGHVLSIHSWGAAIDLDPERNSFGRKYDEAAGMMPHAVTDIFVAEGWTWLGRASTPDAMHHQAAGL